MFVCDAQLFVTFDKVDHTFDFQFQFPTEPEVKFADLFRWFSLLFGWFGVGYPLYVFCLHGVIVC